MAMHSYGVLKGRVCDYRRATREDPHVHLHLIAREVSYRASINVRSRHAPSVLEYALIDPFNHPMLARLAGLAEGWTKLPRRPGGCALDYIRGGLVEPAQMRRLPFERPGPANDLNELIERFVQRALADPRIEIYVFGELWGPDYRRADAVFGFLPGRGLHNIHMNQASGRAFRGSDGVWQDGAVLFHFPHLSRWIALFLKFQSQGWRSHDRTGQRIERGQRGGSAPRRTQPRRQSGRAG